MTSLWHRTCILAIRATAAVWQAMSVEQKIGEGGNLAPEQRRQLGQSIFRHPARYRRDADRCKRRARSIRNGDTDAADAGRQAPVDMAETFRARRRDVVAQTIGGQSAIGGEVALVMPDDLLDLTEALLLSRASS